jgi:hypothetical protein
MHQVPEKHQSASAYPKLISQMSSIKREVKKKVHSCTPPLLHPSEKRGPLNSLSSRPSGNLHACSFSQLVGQNSYALAGFRNVIVYSTVNALDCAFKKPSQQCEGMRIHSAMRSNDGEPVARQGG